MAGRCPVAGVRPAALRPRARAERARSRGAGGGVLRARAGAARGSLAGHAASAASAFAIPITSTPRTSISSAPAGCSSCWSTTRTAAGEDVLAGVAAGAGDPATMCASGRPRSPSSRRGSTCAKTSRSSDPTSTRRSAPHDLLAWAAAPPQLAGRWPRVVLPLRGRRLDRPGRPVDLDRRAARLAGAGAGRAGPPGARAFGMPRTTSRTASKSASRSCASLADADRADRARAGRRARCSSTLRARLHATGCSPADEIRRLARLVEILSSGHNQIFAPISALLLLGTQLAFAVERWRARCGPAVPGWLDVVAEIRSALRRWRPTPPNTPITRSPSSSTGAAALRRRDALAHPLLPRRPPWPTTSSSAAARRTCCSSAARTCRARARCCARSASTPCWRRPARPCGPRG